MIVLLFGGNGWIGNQIINLLKQKSIQYFVSDCKIRHYTDALEEIKKYNPTHIICLIGRTHGTYNGIYYKTIDYLEQKGKLVENVRDNLFVPVILANICRQKEIHLTYFGTGCIFKFDETHTPYDGNGFTEEDYPNFTDSSYSTVKGYTDELMHMYEDSALNLRIRMPISSEINGRNFITKIVNYEKICSVPNSMTVLDELLPIMLDMMHKGTTGTVNMTNPELITHNEILEMYRDIVDPTFKWTNFSIEEQSKILAAGRSNNYLDSTKLKLMYPELKNIKDSVRETLIKMAEGKK